jgi:hypothetical protein
MADVPEKTLSDELKRVALADYSCPNPFPCQGDDSFDHLQAAALQKPAPAVDYFPK